MFSSNRNLFAFALAALLAAGVALGTAEWSPAGGVWSVPDPGLKELPQSARLVWCHRDGHFEYTRGNQWVEVNFDGTFSFREVYRGRESIDLHDSSRDCHVRLTANACYVRFGSGSYRLLYIGYWER